MKNKKVYCVVVLVLVLLLCTTAVYWFKLKDAAWVCQGGQWQKRGWVLGAAPNQACTEENKVIASSAKEELSYSSDLIIKQPGLNGDIASNQTISGFAAGTWYFEGSFDVEAIQADGKLIGTCLAKAQDNWMTDKPVAFTCALQLDEAYSGKGFLVFKKSNPSGLKEHDKSYRYPVVFQSDNTQVVKVFFANEALSSGDGQCAAVAAVSRLVVKNNAPARAALEALLAGPTIDEFAGGWQTGINDGVKIISLTIKEGVATLELSAGLEKNLGGSCRVTTIRAQIEATLKQFETVKEVVIKTEGKSVEETLQP